MAWLKNILHQRAGAAAAALAQRPSTAKAGGLVRRLHSTAKASSQATYYDSQSGMHVPVHKEEEISIYYHALTNKSSGTVVDNLQPFGGLILPAVDDYDSWKSLLQLAPPGFQLFSYNSLDELGLTEYRGATCRLVDINPSNTDNPEEEEFHLEELLQSHTKNCIPTLFVLGKNCFHQEPILVANHVASLIDATKSGNYVWLSTDTPTRASTSTSSVDTDAVIQLCEELTYLDIPGAIMKSRLVVTVMDDEDLVDEIMVMGVNKFVVNDLNQITLVEDVVKEQGKTRIRW